MKYIELQVFYLSSWKRHKNEMAFWFFYANRFGKGPLRNCWNLGFKFAEIFIIKILLSAMWEAAAKIALR